MSEERLELENAMSRSFTIEWSELRWTLRSIDGKLVVWAMLNYAGVDHLSHQIRRSLSGFVLLLKNHKSLLKLMDLLDPRLVLGFPLGRSLLVGFDLCDGSSSLAGDF